MKKQTGAKQQLSKLAKVCLTFPEATREDHGSHATFRVRKRVFAYFLDNHHGDGKVSVCCKMTAGENRELAGLDPEKFYIPAYIGAQGWVALRLDRGEVNWNEVEELVSASYALAAPKKLAQVASTHAPSPPRTRKRTAPRR